MDVDAPYSSSSGQNVGPQDARGLLALARNLVNQGKPSHALQAVMAVVKSYGGDDAVLGTLTRAREQYKKKILENAAAAELASLFAECAISQAQPLVPESMPIEVNAPLLNPDAEGASILAKSGRKQIMLDAFADGSSFICLQCGGLVSSVRKDEHLTYWCDPIRNEV